MKVIRNIIIFLLIVVIIFFAISFVVVGVRTLDTKIQYQDTINKYAKEYNADPLMIASIINVESGFDTNAVSSMDAKGLMQIVPETGRWIADKLDIEYEDEMLFDPDYNVKLGAYYYEYLYEYYGDETLALAAYNGGMGNVDDWLDNPEYSKDGKKLDTIPFDETRNYVNKVLNSYETYSIFYGSDLPRNKEDKDLIVENYKTFLKDIAKSF